VVFPARGHTKLDLCNYYLAVADACLGHLRDRPTTMKRYPSGAGGDFFFQKRVPDSAPPWLEQMTIQFPSGRDANLLVCQDRAHMAWGLNLGVIDWNPWPVRRSDGDHPDEMRVDLDPTPEASFADVREVALCAREVLEEHGLTGFPKTSGSRGMHILVRIEPRWDFIEVRRAAVALAREIERRRPGQATSAWWKEERRGVFVDYNQNARDRRRAAGLPARHRAGATRGGRRPERRARRRRGLARLAARAGGARRGQWAGGRAVAAALSQAGAGAEAGAAVEG
jgi:DNA ligase D-like protein (predicted polymerase)